MFRSKQRVTDWKSGSYRALLLATAVLSCVALSAAGQHSPMDASETTRTDTKPARTRLILKDGSYQLVVSYTVEGDLVRFVSAERVGSHEEIPLSLVDIPATQKWAQEHDPSNPSQPRKAVLSPELQKEEAELAARTPEVAKNLNLPEETSVLVLDTYNGAPDLVPVPQEGGDLNHETAHNLMKGTVNPASSPHRILDVSGVKSDIQLHVADPVFYVRVGPDDAGPGGGFQVDTQGASGRATPTGGNPDNDYVIERLDVRSDTRVVDSFRFSFLGVKPQRDVIELKSEKLPGGHWLKLTPTKPLDFGEYALIEILNDHELNLGVWTFGVHPTAPENAEAIHPRPERSITLERRHQP